MDEPGSTIDDGSRGVGEGPGRARRAIPHEEVGRWALVCVLSSLLCAGIVVAFHEARWVRGVVGSLGFNAGAWGLGVAFWCSVRLRDRLCYLAAALSVPNVVAWAYVLDRVIHDWRP
ncbi:hypothetical protein [Paludisphaera mucosa]|uniref:Integral membrane protein n=1 Tax=Paludisphaera mucosa TaxID=3030827 RepID=A0ABT6FBD0_9BACT|nr:hypothetical protein [Paludisphaera mucosa]MDG3004859.1 hypothetical protein [Paludisphaera mucosa]